MLHFLLLAALVSAEDDVSVHDPDYCWSCMRRGTEAEMRRVFEKEAGSNLELQNKLRDQTTPHADKSDALGKLLGRKLGDMFLRHNHEEIVQTLEEKCKMRAYDPCTTARYDRALDKCIVKTDVTKECTEKRKQRGIRFI